MWSLSFVLVLPLLQKIMYCISERVSIMAQLSNNMSTKLRESIGFSVQLFMFLQWPTGNVIGYKSHVIAGKEMVREIWCKTCAKHSDKLLISLRGQASGRLQEIYQRHKLCYKVECCEQFAVKGSSGWCKSGVSGQ